MAISENSNKAINDSNMKLIIKSLKEKTDKSSGNYGRWMDSTTGWNHLDSLPYTPAEISELILNTVQDITELKSTMIPSPVIRERYGFSLVKQADLITPWRKEEALERLLLCVHSNLKNQFSVGGGKESIDMIKIDSKHNILSIIELKHDAGGGTPLYAIIELLKNYELLKKQNLDKSLKTLELLAPKSYFDYFKKSFEYFEKVIAHINNRLQTVRIEILFVDADVKDINKVLSKLKLDLKWEKSNKSKYDYKVLLTADKVKSLAELLKLKLEIKIWTSDCRVYSC